MILNFKTHFPNKKPFNKKPTNFADKIERKIKIHTMREDVGNRWHDGVMAHLSTGARSRNYRCLAHLPVKIQMVEIKWARDVKGRAQTSVMPVMKIDGRVAGIMEQILLASNDGFDNMDDFWAWFHEDKIYKLLHWTDFIYDGNVKKLDMVKR